ncbi:MAG: hypothetical protein QOE41_1591, partial [Mycobacterium sp.]|nr:hypothetical protein [Mycobacterium sp.]
SASTTPRRFFHGPHLRYRIRPLSVQARLLGLLIRPTPPSAAMGILVGSSLIVVETLIVCLLNEATGTTGRFGTLYLLGILALSTVWGFGVSATMSVGSAIAFAYFRNWPAGHFAPFAPHNGMVIAIFLVLALLANTVAGLARVGERFFNLSSDLMCISSGEYVIRVNPACERTLGYSTKELQSRPYLDFVVREDREHVRAQLTASSTETVRTEDRMICSDGTQCWIEWNIVPRRGMFYAVGRDVTQRRREQDELRQAQRTVEASRDRLRALAEQQTALRRVATLVARGVNPSEVFAAVADEIARCLDAANATVSSFDDDTVTIVAVAALTPGLKRAPLVGVRRSLEGDNIATRVFHTGRPARLDGSEFQNAAGRIAAWLRQTGLHSTVAVPIIVDGRVWGMAALGSLQPEPMPADTEARMSDFADLVATAIANAATRSELIASRARIVAAADEGRRRLERDLHDGAQQRLVSLGLQARLAEGSVPSDMPWLKAQLDDIASALTGVSRDLQEISRGIHPAILSKGGIGPALKALARRSAVPVTLDLAIDQRLPDPVEVGAYYLVSEALTNAAKHSRATQVDVCGQTKDHTLLLSIHDDGIGGADVGKGSGLLGLRDRVEALGGRMRIKSPTGSGTSLEFTIPIGRQ